MSDGLQLLHQIHQKLLCRKSIKAVRPMRLGKFHYWRKLSPIVAPQKEVSALSLKRQAQLNKTALIEIGKAQRSMGQAILWGLWNLWDKGKWREISNATSFYEFCDAEIGFAFPQRDYFLRLVKSTEGVLALVDVQFRDGYPFVDNEGTAITVERILSGDNVSKVGEFNYHIMNEVAPSRQSEYITAIVSSRVIDMHHMRQQDHDLTFRQIEAEIKKEGENIVVTLKSPTADQLKAFQYLTRRLVNYPIYVV